MCGYLAEQSGSTLCLAHLARSVDGRSVSQSSTPPMDDDDDDDDEDEEEDEDEDEDGDGDEDEDDD